MTARAAAADVGPTRLFSHSQPGRYVPLAEAARVLGVSIDVLRKRCRRGEVDARQVQRPQGIAWEVWLTDAELEAGPDVADVAAAELARRPPALELAAALEPLAQLANRLADESARAARAEAERDALAARIRELELAAAPSGRRWWHLFHRTKEPPTSSDGPNLAKNGP